MNDPQGNEQVEEKLPSAIPTEIKPAETEESTLPDEATERTKVEFEKLKEHNAQLKAQLDAYKGKTSVLDDLRPSTEVSLPLTPSLTQTQVEGIKGSLVDENGYVDVARLEAALRNADERAKAAEDKAQRAESRVQIFEESAQVRVAHKEFPQLDPKSDSFDAKFYELVRNDLIGQMMKGERDIMKAAQHVSELYSPKPDVSKAKEEAVKEYKSKVTKRDQATEAQGSRGTIDPSEKEDLIRKTQSGDRDALFKRLQASGN